MSALAEIAFYALAAVAWIAILTITLACLIPEDWQQRILNS